MILELQRNTPLSTLTTPRPTLSESTEQHPPAATRHPKSMTTLTIADLEALLGVLGLNMPIPHLSAANVLNKPLDIGRSYFADILCSLIDCDAKTAYNSIQWPGHISNGDFAIILPKLSRGANPNLGKDLMNRVWHFLSYYGFVSFQKRELG